MIPLKTGGNKSKKPPWLSNRITNFLAKRNQAHKTWKRAKTEADLKKFKYVRAKVEKEIKLAKKRFYFKKFENCIADSRQLLNELKGKGMTKDQIGTVKIDEAYGSDPHFVADAFNEFLATIGKKIKQKYRNPLIYHNCLKVTAVCGYIPQKNSKFSRLLIQWKASVPVVLMMSAAK